MQAASDWLGQGSQQASSTSSGAGMQSGAAPRSLPANPVPSHVLLGFALPALAHARQSATACCRFYVSGPPLAGERLPTAHDPWPPQQPPTMEDGSSADGGNQARNDAPESARARDRERGKAAAHQHRRRALLRRRRRCGCGWRALPSVPRASSRRSPCESPFAAAHCIRFESGPGAARPRSTASQARGPLPRPRRCCCGINAASFAPARKGSRCA